MTLRGDDDLNDYLEHYGIKGMKWGIRRTPEQLGHLVRVRALKARQALGLKGKKVSDNTANAIRILSNKSKSKLEDRSKKKEAKKLDKEQKKEAKKVAKEFEKEQKKEAKALAKEQKKADNEYISRARKELGMNPVEFNKLRDKTLNSHDPEVVVKGMHTLTDSELKEKVARLKTENEIANLAQLRESNRIKSKKAKYEALTSNPIYKIAERTLNDSIHELGLNTIVKGGLQPMLARRITDINVNDYEKRSQKKVREQVIKDRAEALKEARQKAKINALGNKEAAALRSERLTRRKVSDYNRTHPSRQRDPYQIF